MISKRLDSKLDSDVSSRLGQTIDGGPAPDPYANAIYFNGISDLVDFSDTLLPLRRDESWSMAVHVRPQKASTNPIITYHRGTSHRSGIVISSTQVRAGTYGGPWNAVNNYPFTVDEWFHYTLTHNATGEVVTGYVNGAAVPSGSGASLGSLSGSNRSWGYSANGSIYYEGYMLQGNIYDKILTTDEMLYLATFGASGTDPGAPIHTLEEDV